MDHFTDFLLSPAYWFWIPDPPLRYSRSHFSHLNSGENNTCHLGLKGSGVQFLLLLFWSSVMSHPLRSHGLQYARIPVLHRLPEITQTHVHWVGDTIQPSRPLSSPSPTASNLSQHQGLFQSGGQSIRVSASTSVLPMNIQDWFPLWLTG